ncbi:MAG: hypothetical protein HYR60_18545 [Acidobacteria bacterium]|nr:hypothetical protein [Acidobacteriota bacterium]MBI3470345.1 hypothetical protein [Candidatus Solibacter usitatus]
MYLSRLTRFLPAALLIGGWAGPALGSPILPGFDLLHTPDNTAFVQIPNIGNVMLRSVPIPGLGNTDTIVKRNAGITTFPDTIDIELVALSLTSVNPIQMGNSFFDVFVTINSLGLPGIHPLSTNLPASRGQMTVNHNQPNGGTFDSFFDIFVELSLEAVGNPTNRIVFTDNVLITGTGASWTHTAPQGYPIDPRFPSGGFYPGTITHTGPHPTVVPATVPEPTEWLFLGSALGLLAAGRRRKG